MFASIRWVLAAGILIGGLTLIVVGGDSRPNPAAIPVNRDNARHQQLLKLVAKGGGDLKLIRPTTVERGASSRNKRS